MICVFNTIHFCLLMYLKTLEINVLKHELDPAHFLSAPGLAWQACFKKTKAELELLTDIDMLLMVEKRARDGICSAIHRRAKANNKYMKNYNKDDNNLYGRAISQKLPANGFKWAKNLSKFNEIFIINYNLIGYIVIQDIGYILKVDIDYSKKLFNLHQDLPFLRERKRVNKVEKLICSIR